MFGLGKKAGGTHLKLTTVAYARGASTRLHCLHRFHQNRKGTEEVVQARRTDSEVFGGQHRPDLVVPGLPYRARPLTDVGRWPPGRFACGARVGPGEGPERER